MKPAHLACFVLLSFISCGSGEDDQQSSDTSSIVCGDISVNACNPVHTEQVAAEEEEESSPEAPPVDDTDFDLQGQTLRSLPAVSAKIAQLESSGYQVFNVWKASDKDCNVNIGVCGGSVVNDNDTITTTTTVGNGSNVE